MISLAGLWRCLAVSSVQEITARNIEEAEPVDSAWSAGGSPQKIQAGQLLRRFIQCATSQNACVPSVGQAARLKSHLQYGQTSHECTPSGQEKASAYGRLITGCLYVATAMTVTTYGRYQPTWQGLTIAVWCPHERDTVLVIFLWGFWSHLGYSVRVQRDSIFQLALR